MIVDITNETLGQIRNPALADYAAIYLRIYDDFMAQVRATGIGICSDDDRPDLELMRRDLKRHGAIFRNHGRSIYSKAISPACLACQTGVGSATFFISLKCHRDCYYCFNPNQADYDTYSRQQRDLVQELAEIEDMGLNMKHAALTGGEPLLHKEKAVTFFAECGRRFPGVYKRLYTCGDHLDRRVLARLRAAGLDEIRLSIRMHDLAKGHRHTLEKLALAREYIPRVMVEMPVLPGTLEEMKALLMELEALHIHSINLLEFCYPLTNAEAFNERSFRVKRRPYRVLYDYWYAGGVPVSGSEAACLALLTFALEEGLQLGVHYCSLENKLTGQNYQQNCGRRLPKTVTFSDKDYLLKSAKVFGRDVGKVRGRLSIVGPGMAQYNRDYDYLEFNVNHIRALAGLDVEIGLSTSTLEQRPDGDYLRELKVDLTYPALFEPDIDV